MLTGPELTRCADDLRVIRHDYSDAQLHWMISALGNEARAKAAREFDRLNPPTVVPGDHAVVGSGFGYQSILDGTVVGTTINARDLRTEGEHDGN